MAKAAKKTATRTRKRRAGSPSYADKSTNKNRQAMRATVVGQSIRKEVGQTNTMPVDGKSSSLGDANVIVPPYDKLVLAQLPENNSELGQIIEAMEVNIEGFGGRLVMKDMPEEVVKNKEADIKKEKKELRRLLISINPDLDITALRRRLRKDIETTGEGYWEIIPTRGDLNKISCINPVESHTLWMTKQDRDFTEIDKTFLDHEEGEKFTKKYWKRFRRYVQRRNNKKIYFKEWGDPRIIDRRDGKAYKNVEEAKKAAKDFDEKKHIATAIKHFRIYNQRTPYGLPRFIGNLFSIFGSRAAEEVNWNTFENNNVPSMAVLVSGNGMLTDGTVKRIEEFTHQVMKRDKNYSKMLILEAEPSEEGIPNSGTAKIDIVPLTNTQHKDQLFQEYDKNNNDKVRRSFRLPPIFVGRAEDYTRATAESSRRLADEQVFAPERKCIDDEITNMFQDQGYVYWEYKSYSPNVTDDQDLVKILSSTEKTGALTPNLARKVLSDILNHDIPLYKQEEVGFNPDVPFSLTMAEAVKSDSGLPNAPQTGVTAPNQGQLKMQSKLPKEVRDILHTASPESSEIDSVKEWRDTLDAYLEGKVPEDSP